MNKKIIILSLALILFFAGCAQNQETKTEERAATTTQTAETTTTVQTTTTTVLAAPMTTTSAAPATSTTKPPKVKADITQEECYAKNYYWCAGKCSSSPCGNCNILKRCVVIDDVVMVETAQDAPGKEGSCVYAKNYVVAGGTGGYCDRNEGESIYAKCGGGADTLDCMQAYNITAQTVFWIAQKRSFHSNMGEEYDLWCFSCENAI